jgi:MFS transporter, DHA1 family, tetracycline resistance protein
MSMPSERKALIFVFITILIDTIGFGIIVPVMPALISELTGEGTAEAARYGGWLYFLYAFTMFFCSPIVGGLSDRFGRRPVLLCAMLALGIDYCVMGFAPTIAWLFAGRFVAGIAGATYSPAYALIADISPPEKRAQNFGLVGAAFGAGFIIGPTVGGLLGELGPRVPFFAAAAFALANFTFGFFALPETHKLENRRKFEWSRANPVGTLLQLNKYPAIMSMLAVVFLWQVAHQVLPATWAYYTQIKFQWSPSLVGASLAMSGVVMIISQGALTRVLVKRFGGERRAAFVGMCAGMIMYLCYGLATQGWMMFVIAAFWLLAGLAWPSMNALLSQQVPPNAQGELQGGLTSLGSMAAIVGPPMMTQLLAYASTPSFYFPGAPFVLAAMLVMVSLTLLRNAARAHAMA